MNIPDPLSEARKHLADAINQTQIAYAAPLMVSPWIAMSCLQKAIRRGHEHLALRAAATLLKAAPDHLWRRCCGIAFEDIGLADLQTVTLVMAVRAKVREIKALVQVASPRESVDEMRNYATSDE